MATTVLCPHCHVESESSAEFCSRCGGTVADVTQAQQEQEKATKLVAEMVVQAGSIEKAQALIRTKLEESRQEMRRLLSESNKTCHIPSHSEHVRNLKAAIGIEPDREELTPLETYRLAYEADCAVDYGGIRWTARQVSLLQEPFIDDGATRQEFYKTYNVHYRKGVAGPLKGRMWQALLVVAIIVFISVVPRGLPGVSQWMILLSVAAVAYSCVRLDRINIHWNGFYDGYCDGKRTGVHDALGLTADEKSDLVKRNKDMEAFEEQFPEFARKWVQK